MLRFQTLILGSLLDDWFALSFFSISSPVFLSGVRLIGNFNAIRTTRERLTFLFGFDSEWVGGRGLGLVLQRVESRFRINCRLSICLEK